jgi:tight adherence protein B
MGGPVIFALVTILLVLGVGGAVFAFAETGGTSKKRLQSVSRQTAVGSGARNAADNHQKTRRNVQALLKDIEKQQAQQKQRPSLRRRLEQAGLTITPRTYYIICGIVALVSVGVCFLTHRPWYIPLGVAPFFGYALPRWILSFMIKRRIKAFTAEFANAIDVIVRSVKSGLPTNEALKIVAREMAAPVGPEFFKLTEGLKVGVTLEAGLKKMFESMPTSEVSFFGIVMTIQQKSGGNLSEALGNLAGVLRDRKRLQGKIKAMSSEAKASAMIIGSLPPVVGFLVWMSTPTYIESLFTERMGNLMLVGCALWMGTGIWVMSKMIAFKH